MEVLLLSKWQCLSCGSFMKCARLDDRNGFAGANANNNNSFVLCADRRNDGNASLVRFALNCPVRYPCSVRQKMLNCDWKLYADLQCLFSLSLLLPLLPMLIKYCKCFSSKLGCTHVEHYERKKMYCVCVLCISHLNGPHFSLLCTGQWIWRVLAFI